MWKANDNKASQPQEDARRPSLNPTDWDTTFHPRAWTSESPEDVSPRSQGEIPLDSGRAGETNMKAGDPTRAARATLHCDMQPGTLDSVRLTEAARSATTRAAQGQGPGKCVSPELLKELRKIIREEFEQLSKDAVSDPRDKDGDHTPQPPAARERPSSPVRPFVSAEAVLATSLPPKDTDEKGPGTPPALTTGQQRNPPKPSTVRFSDETKPAVPDPYSEEARRAPPVRAGPELTTIDKKWGVLFEKDGSHTKRMEHVVRGLANYIVEEFMPQKSIVITPEKMAAFYSHHRLEKEWFPFAGLFGSPRRSSDFNEVLGRLYMDLGCQYFLTQADDRSRPTIPSLTPQGFVHWLTTMIQAYPDEEARRLDKVVSALPLEADSLLDGKAERLPKQISRYLFPDQASRKTRRLVDEALNDFKEDIESSAAPPSKGAAGGGTGRPAPLIVTANPSKRASMSAAGVVHPRYVPEPATREAQGGEASSNSSSHKDRRATTTTTTPTTMPPSTTANSTRGDFRDPEDRSRRNPMPPLPTPHKTARPASVDINGRSTPIREAWGAPATVGALGRTSSSASTRKNRSPQRNTYSLSTPSGLDRSDHGGGERFHGPASGSAAAAAAAAAENNAAAGVLGPAGSAQSLASISPQAVVGKGLRDAKNAEYLSQQYRDKRPSLDESSSRYKGEHEGGGGGGSGGGTGSRSSKRRSMVLPDTKGPTWDEYLKSSAVLGGTTSATKRDSRHHSSN